MTRSVRCVHFSHWPTRRLTAYFFVFVGLVTALTAASYAQTEPSTAGSVLSGKPSLQPGDAVKLVIWREPDLSGEFSVDDSGNIVFPKIGTVHVTSLSADSVKHFLVDAYTPFLRDPSIEVTLLRRVTVAGFVRSPGVYKVDATMNVASVLALAGGPSSDGVANKVELRRHGVIITDDLSGDSRVDDSPLRSDDELYVPQRSWLSRNVGVVATALSTVAIVAVTVISR